MGTLLGRPIGIQSAQGGPFLFLPLFCLAQLVAWFESFVLFLSVVHLVEVLDSSQGTGVLLSLST